MMHRYCPCPLSLPCVDATRCRDEPEPAGHRANCRTVRASACRSPSRLSGRDHDGYACRSEANVELYGPGDVVGIDPRHIIRTEPRDFTVNYEPNYLCGIEFDAPDFPWLFTPAAPKGDQSAAVAGLDRSQGR